MPKNDGECKIRHAPMTSPSYPHRSTLPSTAVVWNASDTKNSSINRVQRFPKQRLQSQDSHTHCFPVPARAISSVWEQAVHTWADKQKC